MRALALESITRKLPVAVYALIVLVPVVLFGHDARWSGTDGIALHDRRPFPSRFAPSMFPLFDEWFAHRIGLRYPLVRLGTELHVGVLRRPLNQRVYFGRDGWLYWTDEETVPPANMIDVRGRLRFTPQEVERADAQLRSLGERFRTCGIPLVVAISPNKQSIYPEYAFVPGAEFPPTRLDALLGGLSAASRATIVDPRQRLIAAKKDRDPLLLYSKTDSHWNALGAFYGYQAIMQALARSMPIANPEFLSLESYNVSSAPFAGGDIATNVLLSPWRFADENVTVQPKRPQPIEMTHGGSYSLMRNPQGKGRLVLFGGSFTDRLRPFLALNFEEVHTYASGVVIGSAVARHRPDAVVRELVERYSPRLMLPTIEPEKICGR